MAVFLEKTRVRASGAAVEYRSDPLEVGTRIVAAGRREHQKRARVAWEAEPSVSRGRQNELPHAFEVAQRKLLRERAAPRYAEHVHGPIAEHVERPDHEPREARKATRKPSRIAAAGPRDVDRDR